MCVANIAKKSFAVAASSIHFLSSETSFTSKTVISFRFFRAPLMTICFKVMPRFFKFIILIYWAFPSNPKFFAMLHILVQILEEASKELLRNFSTFHAVLEE